MNSRYEYVKDPAERRLVVAVRGAAGAVLAVALLAAALPVHRGQPAATVAVEFAESASAVGLYAAPYDGTEAEELRVPAAVAPRRSNDEFGGFDQLYPHAYVGEPGVLG